ncbi:MAG TPA: hypothetical protein VK550_16595 [Polyangiaceae bacterium]|nr:hypothetical protein [Polyangiaceae bacterium]
MDRIAINTDIQLSPKAVRVRAGVAVHVVAARANVAIGTVRTYELDPQAVTPPKKAALDPVYAQLARQ